MGLSSRYKKSMAVARMPKNSSIVSVNNSVQFWDFRACGVSAGAETVITVEPLRSMECEGKRTKNGVLPPPIAQAPAGQVDQRDNIIN